MSLRLLDHTPAAIADPYPIRRLPLRTRMRLLGGKVRRFCLLHFRKEYVRRSLARRRGQCRHSGACCQISIVCPLHGPDEHGEPGCTVYEKRPQNCRVFPIDERDLRERDIIMPDTPCGYHFVNEAQARTEAAQGKSPDGSFPI